jgi:hypothetical protein
MPRLHKVLRIIKTFILVYIAWIFFRANSLEDSMVILKNLFHFEPGTVINLFENRIDFSIALLSIVFLAVVEILEEQIGLYARLKKLGRPVKWVMLIVLILCIVVLGKWNEVDFLYFQF